MTQKLFSKVWASLLRPHDLALDNAAAEEDHKSSPHPLKGVIVQSEGPQLEPGAEVWDLSQCQQTLLCWCQRGTRVLGLGLLDQTKLLFSRDESLEPLV